MPDECWDSFLCVIDLNNNDLAYRLKLPRNHSIDRPLLWCLSEMMNWDLYRIFLAVADAGSLLTASKRLKLSAQTVSRRIAELEDGLGLKLLARSRVGHSLIGAGACRTHLDLCGDGNRRTAERSLLSSSDDVAPKTVRTHDRQWSKPTTFRSRSSLP
jgi:Bacterial regulatory helix-turn-helix protein, lysR family